MPRRATLLLVEDEPLLRRLVASFLRDTGHEVIEAADGREGVERLGDSGPFALALVDLNLPYLHGVEVCRVARERCPSLPVLVCSAAISVEDEADLRGIGVDQFLTKPYHPDDLLGRVRDLIAGRLGPPPSIGPGRSTYRSGH